MAKLNICNVVVQGNPSPFLHPFQFEITFECIEQLGDDLEWKIVYVGSAESEEYDQVLDTVVVGPVIVGKHKFVFQADPPDPSKIPREDVVGVTVVLLTCSYRNQEFIRVGYFVSNDYPDAELRENPPINPDFSKLERNIVATQPRVTRFKIDWGDGTDSENVPPPNNTENESNQMAMEQEQPRQGLREEMLKESNQARADLAARASGSAPQSNIVTGSSTGLAGGPVVVNGGGADGEPMQM